MHGTRSAGGFTIVEVMIALILVGVIGGATLSLLMSQDRYYSRLDDAVVAEQSLRASADLMGSEIRMSGVPGDILVAVPESVTVAFDVWQAVVCDITNPGIGQIAMFVYDSAPNPNLTTGTWGMAYKDPYQSTYRYADGWNPGINASSGKATCTGNLAPDTTATHLYRQVSGWPGQFAGDTPQRGAIVRRYRHLSYRFGPSGIGGGYALFRGPQELAGPFDPRSSFSYVMDDGTVQTSVAVSDLDRIRRVRVNATAIDDDPRFDLQRDLVLDIPLRY